MPGTDAVLRQPLRLFCVTSALLSEALAPFRSNPARTAVLLDIDGTLAPIVNIASDATVPEPTRKLLIELSRRYGAVGAQVGDRPDRDHRPGLGGTAAAHTGHDAVPA